MDVINICKVHQIVPGALNNANSFSLGNIEGHTFVACAIGVDLVILSQSFQRIQTISGSLTSRGSEIINYLDCCTITGKIVISFGKSIRIFEPSKIRDTVQNSIKTPEELKCSTVLRKDPIFSFQWAETQRIENNADIDGIFWFMNGTFLLVVSNLNLLLYQSKCSLTETWRSVKFTISTEDAESLWNIVWQAKLAEKVKYLKISSDSLYFATCGESDRFIKIWYQNEGSKNFSFTYIQHPAPVCGFEWRRTSKFMPQKSASNALISWSEDDITRIWKEYPNTTISNCSNQCQQLKLASSIQPHLKEFQLLKRIIRLVRLQPCYTCTSIDLTDTGSAIMDKDQANEKVDLPPVKFILVQTIDRQDCFMVSSSSSISNQKLEERNFTVHWLNNKELAFSHGIQQILSDNLLCSNLKTPSVESLKKESCANNIAIAQSKSSANLNATLQQNIQIQHSSSIHDFSACTINTNEDVQSKLNERIRDQLDIELQSLLRQWTHSFDVLFTIHPEDGSLLTWTLEFLDDPWRQPILSFSSRLPDALSYFDALSLKTFTLYTFSPIDFNLSLDERSVEIEDDTSENGQITGTAEDEFIHRLGKSGLYHTILPSNKINLVTYHQNGTLNLWALAIDAQRNSTAIMNINHVSRLCGHRFTINQIIPHPMLPLMLTTSSCSLVNQTNAYNAHYQQESELILWKITSIGPLCKTGGIEELTRIITKTSSNFNHVAWIPSALSSFVSGSPHISQNSCFIACNSGKLSLFKVIIDVRSLSEIDRAEMDREDEEDASFHNTIFHLNSLQSGPKPGCILFQGNVDDSEYVNETIFLLHVFDKKLVSSSVCQNNEYFIVVVVGCNNSYKLKMWLLTITPQRRPSYGNDLLPLKTSFPPLFQTRKVCETSLDFGPDVKILSCVPSASHLPSFNIYPICKAPHLLIFSCSDDRMRLYSCEQFDSDLYEWKEWKMANSNDSSLVAEGNIYSISGAHCGRIACIYQTMDTSNLIRTPSLFSRSLEISVFECESSGGVEWLREDEFNLEYHHTEETILINYISSIIHALTATGENTTTIMLKSIINVDWVTMENGRYLLAIKIGPLIYIYTQISHDIAQNNIALMKEDQQKRGGRRLLRKNSYLAVTVPSSKLTKWICVRIIILSTNPHLTPPALSWFHEGLLIVGINSEMRVYNQWNLSTKINNQFLRDGPTHSKSAKFAKSSSNISKSHSMLDFLTKRSMDRQTSSKIVYELISRAFPSTKVQMISEQGVLEAINDEGLFEAARLANPQLPQYHPKQLIEMLNSGKTRRVKAILMHILLTLKANASANEASVESKKFSFSDNTSDVFTSRDFELHRRNSIVGSIHQRNAGAETEHLEYEELDSIVPLPLHAIFSADRSQDNNRIAKTDAYQSLFETSHDSVDSCQAEKERPIELSTTFTTKDSNMLTELLTHVHLPGLSSMDQMHFLAIADTISHFSSNVDKLEQLTANKNSEPTLEPSQINVLNGYTHHSTSESIETVDECGLRFLMAKKQYEYLLRYLPPFQRKKLITEGLSTAYIIWAFHSDCEVELLNSISCCQKGEENWEDLRAYGVAWWLKNPANLRTCIEKVAKNSFQREQNPMDASLYYLAMRKKNILTQLFRTVNDSKMFEFFRENFNEEKWKKAALKNAFVLMSKQRYKHAAAFFLLGGSLKDALQILSTRLNDLQLAITVLRLYENDSERQLEILTDLLCREVLNCEHNALSSKNSLDTNNHDNESYQMQSTFNKDPFLRSMAYWLIKDYVNSAKTLLIEATRSSSHFRINSGENDGNLSSNLPDIFNFYSFLRKNPFVIRQHLTNSGIHVFSTEQFLFCSREIGQKITKNERRLYFRTACTHLTSGCPLLALDVLNRLPKSNDTSDKGDVEVDKIAQHLKFFSILQIIEDELNTLASGFEIDGGQLRFELFEWLEKEFELLSELCGFGSEFFSSQQSDDVDEEANMSTQSFIAENKYNESLLTPLHEALHKDRIDLKQRIRIIVRRKKWLKKHQQLINTLISYCSLHSAQNYRLIPIQMELMLLLLEIQDEDPSGFSNEFVPDIHSFPLLVSFVSSTNSPSLSSPLQFIINQSVDILKTITDFIEPPKVDKELSKVYMLYNLAQGLSACIYQSLSGLNNLSHLLTDQNGPLTSLMQAVGSASSDIPVTSAPSKWPGAESLIVLLSREHALESSSKLPTLRLILVESFFAITLSLFCYAFTMYDSRWLFRLCAHPLNAGFFAEVFGGGGERRLRTAVPVRPPPPKLNPEKEQEIQQPNQQFTQNDSGAIRAKLHAKVFGADSALKYVGALASQRSKSDTLSSITSVGSSEQVLQCWVPPKKHIVQYFAEQVPQCVINCNDIATCNSEESFTSDSDEDSDNLESQTDTMNGGDLNTFLSPNIEQKKWGDKTKLIHPHDDPNSYAWLLIRLSILWHLHSRLSQFLVLAGFDPKEISQQSPNLEAVMSLFKNWAHQIEEQIRSWPDTSVVGLLQNMEIESESATQYSAPLLKKYSVLLQKGNTPFEYEARGVANVRRLWSFLIHQDDLAPHFVRFIFARLRQAKDRSSSISSQRTRGSSRRSSSNRGVFESVKIVQREHEPIQAFACNPARPGCIVVATSRELQEMSIEKVLEERDRVLRSRHNLISSFIDNRVELDVAMQNYQRDILLDNDDYQLITGTGDSASKVSQVHSSAYLRKRKIGGIRRLGAHSTMPYYVSGASDGSITFWEWGMERPVFTTRVPSQSARITNVVFAPYRNIFAAVDGDGMLSMWNPGSTSQKPIFSQKCHTKTAFDVAFVGHTSSLLVTAGHSTGDQNVALWDTLMPQGKSLIHSFVGHQDGASCITYLLNTQAIVSGGRRGEICIWDIRQRQLRSTMKAFDSPSAIVKCLCMDPNCDLFVAGSSEGDMKIWTTDQVPRLFCSLSGEHVSKGGFSLRNIGSSSVQGVQQVFVDSRMNLLSIGADNSLKLRLIPPLI